MLLILFTILFLFFLLTFIISETDIISPPVLVTAGFLISGLFALFLVGPLWSGELSVDTLFVYTVGISAFLVGYYVIYSVVGGKSKHHSTVYEEICLGNIFIVFYIITSVMIGYLYYRTIIGIVGNYGTWTEIMARYRLRSAYGNTIQATASIPGYISVSRMFLQSGAYVLTYVLAQNWVVKRKVDKRIIIALLVDIVASMIAAQRLDVVRIPIAFMTFYFIIKKKSGDMVSSEKTRLYIRYVALGIIVLAAFAGVKSVVGRNASDIDVISYLSKYIGGPIPLFDDFLKNPIRNKSVLGMESFWGIYNVLYSLTGNENFLYDYTLEFRTISGTNMGNVYSAFRMYYADFGFAGVVILPLVMGGIFAVLYSSVLQSSGRSRLSIKFIGKPVTSAIDFKLLILGVIIHSCILMFYQDWFFAHVLEWYQIKSFIFMWLFKLIFIDLQNKKNNG